MSTTINLQDRDIIPEDVLVELGKMGFNGERHLIPVSKGLIWGPTSMGSIIEVLPMIGVVSSAGYTVSKEGGYFITVCTSTGTDQRKASDKKSATILAAEMWIEYKKKG